MKVGDRVELVDNSGGYGGMLPIGSKGTIKYLESTSCITGVKFDCGVDTRLYAYRLRVIDEKPEAPNTKPSNPKDIVGSDKVALSYVPATVIMETALGMMEGGLKYGRHNYRAVGVRASIYYDAASRHLAAWWEGEDLDPDSGLSHVTKAICSLVVLRDAMLQNKLTDDRPPKAPAGWLQRFNATAKRIVAANPEPVQPVTETDMSWAREAKQ